jgi:hypothetical protein
MVDFKVTNAYSPMLFTTDGYQLVTMPMMTSEASEQAKRDREAKEAEPTTTEQAEPVTEPEVSKAVAEAEAVAQAVAEAEAIAEAKAKPKHSRKRDKVAKA